MKKTLSTIVALLLLTQIAVSQIKTWKNPSHHKAIAITQWEVNDVVYHIKKNIDKPFSKQAIALVSGAEGTQRIPMFFNDNGNWVLRFSASKTGEYAFVIESEIKQLNGKKGKFVVLPNQKKDRHGAIVLHKEKPQHLFYQDGKHYFNLAFECDWLFALDYQQKELAKTKHLLKLLNEYKFNQVVMNVYSYDVSWPKDKLLAEHPEHEYGGREDIFPFLGSNSKPDYSALNIDFFKHFDKLISEMHDHEIVSHLMIYVWNKLVKWPDMESDADNMYYDYVVKRYQAFPNIIWDVSKEALFYGRATNQYILERIERTRKLDAYNRLLSVHDYGFCRENADKVDFISTQDWKLTLYESMLNVRNTFKNKPVFNIEHGGYEASPYVVFPGAFDNPETCLRRNYECLFAGIYTTYYWQAASWNIIIHNPFQQPKNFVKPRFDYFKHMRKLFDSVNFENCEPYFHHNSSGYNLSNKKDGIVLMYVPKETHWVGVSGLMKNHFDDEKATQQWFNTLTGEFTPEEPFDKKAFDFWKPRPFKNEADAILIIKNLRAKE